MTEKKAKETKISKILLTVEGKKIAISMEGAKALKGMLEDLFGKVEYRDRWHYWSYPHWYPNQIYCGTAANSSNTIQGLKPLNSLDKGNTNAGLIGYCANALDVSMEVIGSSSEN